MFFEAPTYTPTDFLEIDTNAVEVRLERVTISAGVATRPFPCSCSSSAPIPKPAPELVEARRSLDARRSTNRS
jgi:hypothetical protein